MHREADHCFYIIEGIYTFTLGAEEIKAPAGSVVFVPHGTPHAFKHSEGARALGFVIPAQLEGFFRELGEGLAAGRSEAELRDALARKYDSWPAG
jgi:quercetin dioxygenase-like cupin family protein